MMERPDHPVQVVESWIAAVNEGDVERAGTLVTDDVSIIGPRGTTGGREAVRGWISHTGIQITAHDVTANGDLVTVEADGTWLSEGGEPGARTLPAPISMHFTVRDGRIASIERL